MLKYVFIKPNYFVLLDHLDEITVNDQLIEMYHLLFVLRNHGEIYNI